MNDFIKDTPVIHGGFMLRKERKKVKILDLYCKAGGGGTAIT